MMEAILSVNQRRPGQLVAQLRETLGELRGAIVGVLGLSFKENTDDIRESPSLALAGELLAAGADARGYDPVAGEVARAAMPQLQLASDAYTLAEGADALVVGTAWNEFNTWIWPASAPACAARSCSMGAISTIRARCASLVSNTVASDADKPDPHQRPITNAHL